MSKQNLWGWLESNENLLIDIAQKIWDNPEPSLEEKFASDLQSSILEKEGFRINKGTGEMPTAFVAEYGDGSPILGVLGEYDALPGLSQKKTAHQEVAKEGAAGHGCGHSLLGTAGLGAALAIKQAIDEGEI